MKLFVDDERPAPEGWVLAKTSSEALTILTKVCELGHTLDAISLDHACGEEWLVGMTQRYAPPGTLKGYGCNFWGTCKSDSIERHLVQHRG